MSNWIAKAENGNERECESRAKAEEVKSDMEDLGMDVEIIKPDMSEEPQTGPGTECEECGTDIPADAPEDATLCEHHGSWALATPPETDGGAQTAADVMETEETTVDTSGETNATESGVVGVSENLPDRSLNEDPIDWLKKGASELTANIKGTTVITKKGFRVLQHHYDISTGSEVVVGPEENGHEFCRVKAWAEMPNGRRAEAHASAHVDRGDDHYLLTSMADTRAKSRALSDVTGVGSIAMAELTDEFSNE